MVCTSFIRSVIVQAGHFGVLAQGRQQLSHIKKTFSVGFGFRTSAKMMVDASAGEKRVSLVDMPPEKVDDAGYIGGGWKNDDGSLSCGYCSFRGKRSTMEDFYDIKASKIDGQTVCMFGIFDGHGGSRAAEYLKEHLFDNLMKHPQFLTDTKLALSETYKQTDVAFLESEKDTYRDDGSTASTAVLVGNHLYVANVGDSRTIVSKSGKAIALSDDHKPNRSDERKRIESAGGVIMWAEISLSYVHLDFFVSLGVFWSILEHMGHEEHGGTWHMDAAQLDTQRKKGEAILKTSSTVYSTNRSSSSTRPAKLQLDRAEKSTVKPEKCCFPLDFPLTLNLILFVFKG
ncbi:unnamed protein product [Microthlaspi erraticum]|uniref:protein-serine/threonine phosphatase n=1 Tax=Microthlaspi erraticum TaxID=1685480 RepID=A0A6D2K9U9_9BRAS|nr:unnamed protein product [Microthlaspi erraticum]